MVLLSKTVMHIPVVVEVSVHLFVFVIVPPWLFTHDCPKVVIEKLFNTFHLELIALNVGTPSPALEVFTVTAILGPDFALILDETEFVTVSMNLDQVTLFIIMMIHVAEAVVLFPIAEEVPVHVHVVFPELLIAHLGPEVILSELLSAVPFILLTVFVTASLNASEVFLVAAVGGFDSATRSVGHLEVFTGRLDLDQIAILVLQAVDHIPVVVEVVPLVHHLLPVGLLTGSHPPLFVLVVFGTVVLECLTVFVDEVDLADELSLATPVVLGVDRAIAAMLEQLPVCASYNVLDLWAVLNVVHSVEEIVEITVLWVLGPVLLFAHFEPEVGVHERLAAVDILVSVTLGIGSASPAPEVLSVAAVFGVNCALFLDKLKVVTSNLRFHHVALNVAVVHVETLVEILVLWVLSPPLFLAHDRPELWVHECLGAVLLEVIALGVDTPAPAGQVRVVAAVSKIDIALLLDKAELTASGLDLFEVALVLLIVEILFIKILRSLMVLFPVAVEVRVQVHVVLPELFPAHCRPEVWIHEVLSTVFIALISVRVALEVLTVAAVLSVDHALRLEESELVACGIDFD